MHSRASIKRVLPLLVLTLCANQAHPQQRPLAPPIPLWGRPLPDSLLEEERKGTWLVEIRCVEVNRSSSNRPPSPLVEIIRNFTGSRELVGQRFVPTGAFGTDAYPFPTMAVGDKAILAVGSSRLRSLDEGRQIINSQLSDLYSGYGLSFPVLEKMPSSSHLQTTSFKDALSQARAVERVAKASRPVQIRLLRSYAQSPIAQRSVWGITTLAHSGLNDAPSFLLGLTRSSHLPVQGQLTLDSELTTLDKLGRISWNRSPLRVALLQKLVSSSPSATDQKNIIRHLASLGYQQRDQKTEAEKTNSAYTPSIPDAVLLRWLRLAAENPSWTLSARSEALERIARLGSRDQILRAVTWTYLLQTASKHPDFWRSASPASRTGPEDAALAETAVTVLRYLRPLSPSERAALHPLQNAARSLDLKWAFDELLSH